MPDALWLAALKRLGFNGQRVGEPERVPAAGSGDRKGTINQPINQPTMPSAALWGRTDQRDMAPAFAARPMILRQVCYLGANSQLAVKALLPLSECCPFVPYLPSSLSPIIDPSEHPSMGVSLGLLLGVRRQVLYRSLSSLAFDMSCAARGL